MDTTHVDPKELCVRQVQGMADGAFEDFEAIIHPEARNREDLDEPPASRGRGPAAFYATALWLRGAYAELRWDSHDEVALGDLVVLHATMSGKHTGTLVGYDADALPTQAFPPTGKGSPPPKRTGSAWPTGKSSSTGPTGTTSAPRCSSAGLRRRRCTCCVCCWRHAGPDGRPGDDRRTGRDHAVPFLAVPDEVAH
jgi:hypothetical protein